MESWTLFGSFLLVKNMTKRGRPSKKSREKKLDERYNRAMETKESKERKLQDELGSHASDSETFLSTLRSGWDEKEAILICKLKDEISTEGSVKSQVFDPRLSTIVFERAARVMARHPSGKAYAISKNDFGKSKLMNLLLRYYEKNANYWHPLIVKLRMLDLYSLVYGTMFALVPWIIDSRRDYIGPEIIPLPIRACFPQPSATSLSDSDWFQVSSMKNIEWLKQQTKRSDKWKNIDKLENLVLGESGEGSGDSKPASQESYVETEWYGGQPTDAAFPKVELRTEYRRDRWITFTPNYDNLIVRDIPNPYDNGELPIVAKYAWPLMESIIGLGEFERGKTLQYSINSLINLYMDAVKYSIFPPIHMNPKAVIRSSIKWGPGERWLMKRPGEDVKQMRLSPQGLSTFQSTYGFLISALMNQAGTTEISSPTSTQPTMGRTPQAIRMMAGRESARDEWDRTMMEETLKQTYGKWITMIVKKMERKVVMRIFGPEVKEISKEYKDLVEFFDKNKKEGVVRVGKSDIEAKYDFEIETGSIMKPDLEGEQQNISAVLGMVLKNPIILEAIRAKGKDLDVGELFKRWMIAGGIKDWERIIVDMPPQKIKPKEKAPASMMPPGIAPMAMPPGMPPMMPGGTPPMPGMPGMPGGVSPISRPMPGGTPPVGPIPGGMPPPVATPLVGVPAGPVGRSMTQQPPISDPEIASTWAAIQEALGEIRSVPPMGR